MEKRLVNINLDLTDVKSYNCHGLLHFYISSFNAVQHFQRFGRNTKNHYNVAVSMCNMLGVHDHLGTV